jgi:hypothetical protein
VHLLNDLIPALPTALLPHLKGKLRPQLKPNLRPNHQFWKGQGHLQYVQLCHYEWIVLVEYFVQCAACITHEECYEEPGSSVFEGG